MLATATIAFIVALKVGLPFLIVRFPFAASWANFLIDAVDGDLLIPLGLSDPTYQTLDKATDWLTYVAMLVAARGWAIRTWIIALFLLRSFGQVLFFATGDERALFLFPNFLEPLFLVYATLRFVKKDRAHEVYLRHRTLAWSLIVVYKLQDEWFLHVANVDRTDLVGRMLGF
jgi:hypothetical protein